MQASSKNDLWVFVARKPGSGGVKLQKVALKDLASPTRTRRSVLDPTLGSQLEQAFVVAVNEAVRAPKSSAKRRVAAPKRGASRR